MTPKTIGSAFHEPTVVMSVTHFPISDAMVIHLTTRGNVEWMFRSTYLAANFKDCGRKRPPPPGGHTEECLVKSILVVRF
jgi:hypothetical protein